jgi:hypothetical protein
LSRWSLKLLFVSINKSSSYSIGLSILHLLDKLEHDVFKNMWGNLDTHG